MALLGFVFAVFLAAGVGGRVAAASIHPWFHTLRQAPLSPPEWLYAPVWTMLYALMAIAAWLAWRTRVSSCRSGGLRMWWVQLFVNLGWTVVFFGLHAPVVALIDLAILIMALVLTIRPFRTIRPMAAYLMVPYLLWSVFAFYLNAGIVFLNR